jgi:hypothetical protein
LELPLYLSDYVRNHVSNLDVRKYERR